MKEIIMLGTGNGNALHCYNTCFAIRNGDRYFLVDAGGGNGILHRLNQADIPLAGIHDIFISHVHADHLLGVFWVMRFIGARMLRSNYDGNLSIYCHEGVARGIHAISEVVLQEKFHGLLGTRIFIRPVEDGQRGQVMDLPVEFFDIHAKGDRQFGFSMEYTPGKKLVFLGDEPLDPALHEKVRACDYMMHEAFCLHTDEPLFRAYEKNHSTVKDACEAAEGLQVKNVILYHTEDKTLQTRKKRYTAEAGEYCSCTVLVPDDLDVIALV